VISGLVSPQTEFDSPDAPFARLSELGLKGRRREGTQRKVSCKDIHRSDQKHPIFMLGGRGLYQG